MTTLNLKQDHSGALDLRSNGLVLELHSYDMEKHVENKIENKAQPYDQKR